MFFRSVMILYCFTTQDSFFRHQSDDSYHLNRSIISTPHVAGHSIRGKLNGTLKLIFELMRFLKIDINKTNEYEKKINSLINFEESKVISSIEQIDTLYDVEKESSSFKKKLIGSNHRIKKKTFNLLRSQHKERQEYIL